MLSDFVVSTPKISNKLVSEYIKNIEQASKDNNGALGGGLGGGNFAGQGSNQKDGQNTTGATSLDSASVADA